MKKKQYSVEDLRKIVRLEDLGSDIWHPAKKGQIKFEGIYTITLDDLETALKTILEKELPVPEVENWYLCLFSKLVKGLGPKDIVNFAYESPTSLYESDHERDALAEVWGLIADFDRDFEEFHRGGPCILMARVDWAVEDISFFRKNRDLPKEQKDYPDDVKGCFIRDNFEYLDSLTEEELKRFVTWVDDLAAKDDMDALGIRCYGKYTGNEAYQQDFPGARDDAEKFFAQLQDSEFANILGNLYYYGRCTDGKPDYDKALTYFTFGAANGIVESIYKLADMYRNGYGVIKSPETALRLITKLYKELVDEDQESRYTLNKLADVALRLGSMLLHGEGTEQDIPGGVSKLLIAQYAIKKRLRERYHHQEKDVYEDNVVAANIWNCLEKAREMLPTEENTGKVRDDGFQAVRGLLEEDYSIAWEAEPLKRGDWAITFKRIKKNEYEPKKRFFTVPETYFCMYTDEIKGRVTPVSKKMPLKGTASRLDIDKKENITVFSFEGKPVLKLKGTSFDWRIPKPEKRSGYHYRLAGVTFLPGGRQYDYLCRKDEDIRPGDKVIVKDDHEEEKEAVVQNVITVAEEDLGLFMESVKVIERKA